jgi:hypothetical protein
MKGHYAKYVGLESERAFAMQKLTPRGGVLLEKLTVLQAVKESYKIEGTRRFVTVSTRASFLSLS